MLVFMDKDNLRADHARRRTCSAMPAAFLQDGMDVVMEL